VVVAGPAAPELLERVHAGLAELWAGHPEVVRADRLMLETAVAEVAANIVLYTGGDAERVEVRLELVAEGDEVAARFVDDGTPAPADLVEEATMPGADAEGGRGLALALAALDHLGYRREGERNLWTLVRRRTA
jgi:serine/threonine-protein kinase RsbW